MRFGTTLCMIGCGLAVLGGLFVGFDGFGDNCEAACLGPDGPERAVVVEVFFSPNGGCQDRIVAEIAGAKKRIRVLAYYFTSKPIAEALIKAKKRGVDCEVIADASQEKMVYGRLPVLRRAGVPVFIDAEHAVANNKVILIDDHTIITGSYNFTKAAEEKNAENVLVLKHHREVFDKYAAEYEKHRSHAHRYSGSSK